jgi:hypothetical protein
MPDGISAEWSLLGCMLHQYRFASQRFAASGRVVGPSGECPWDANLCAGISAMSTALRDKYRKLLRGEFERSQPMSAPPYRP